VRDSRISPIEASSVKDELLRFDSDEVDGINDWGRYGCSRGAARRAGRSIPSSRSHALGSLGQRDQRRELEVADMPDKSNYTELTGVAMAGARTIPDGASSGRVHGGRKQPAPSFEKDLNGGFR
jgi:hypothetical protein